MTYNSVIIPVHNNKELLIKCLDSLKGTICRNKEIIVVDDASEEGFSKFTEIYY